MNRRWTEADLSMLRARLPNDSGLMVVNQPAFDAVRKYWNQPQVVDGHRFDSKLEVARYNELLRLQIAGIIRSLEVHPQFALHAGVHRLGVYIADFSYWRDERYVVEDCKCKATKTALYRWKKHHLQAEYGYEVQEIERRRRA